LRLSILIPAYNEAATIEEVIGRIRAVPLPCEREIVVVDDASRDETSCLLEELAGPDLQVFRHPKNRGKGAALRTGLSHCTGDLILIHDADLEYFPEDIPDLLEAMERRKPAAVYGSRFMGEIRGMRGMNRLANRVLALVASVLYLHRITDEATAYKLFQAAEIQALPLRCERFEFCPEVTARLLKAGKRIVEIPIRYNGRTFDEGKKIGWRDGWEAIWTLLKYRFIN
jgi:glycosyltransferase involved in cell wall biosynthesis